MLLVCKVLEDLQEEEVQEGLRVLRENLEMESQNFKVFLGGLARWVLLVISDPLMTRVRKDLLD